MWWHNHRPFSYQKGKNRILAGQWKQNNTNSANCRWIKALESGNNFRQNYDTFSSRPKRLKNPSMFSDNYVRTQYHGLFLPKAEDICISSSNQSPTALPPFKIFRARPEHILQIWKHPTFPSTAFHSFCSSCPLNPPPRLHLLLCLHITTFLSATQMVLTQQEPSEDTVLSVSGNILFM